MAEPLSKSKKRFAANSQKQPKPTVFFIDRSLGNNIFPSELRKAGLIVETHDSHFSPNEKDETWLSFVGDKGWIVVTQDEKIRYRRLEKMAMEEAGVAAFVLTGGSHKAIEMAEVFIKALSSIKRLVKKTPLPFIARVTRGGAKLIDNK